MATQCKAPGQRELIDLMIVLVAASVLIAVSFRYFNSRGALKPRWREREPSPLRSVLTGPTDGATRNVSLVVAVALRSGWLPA